MRILEMNEIDSQIVQLLKENARMTNVDIGKAVGLSEGAVRNRIQYLIDSGIIKRFTVDIVPDLEFRAIIMVSVNPSVPTSKISIGIRKLIGTERIYEVTGEHDIVAIVSSQNIEGVNHTIEDIRSIEGVTGTNTMIVLRTV